MGFCQEKCMDPLFSQYRTQNQIFQFKVKKNQSCSLKVFDLSRKNIYKVVALDWNILKALTPANRLDRLKQKKILPERFLSSWNPIDAAHAAIQWLIAFQMAKIPLEEVDNSGFICPITQTTFVEPVVDDEGHTFEKSAIEEWLKDKKKICPPFPHEIKTLTPNLQIKEAIEESTLRDPIPTFSHFVSTNSKLAKRNLDMAKICVEQGEYKEALAS